MNNWILTVTGSEPKEHPRKFLELRLTKRYWPMYPQIRGGNRVTKGDRLLFYIGRPECAFTGNGLVECGITEVPGSKHKHYAEEPRFSGEFIIKLTGIKLWKKPILIRPLISQLDFIERKHCWGTYFATGLTPVPDEDFKKIVARAKH